jgi:hypothetical protein
MSAGKAARRGLPRRVMAALGSAIFFVLAPGVVAGLVPWWLTDWRFGTPLAWWDAVRVPGVVLTIAATTIVVIGFAHFVVEGVGTPAPVAPTQHLVVGGV